LNRKFKDDKEI